MVTDRTKRLGSFEPVVQRLNDLICALADSDHRLSSEDHPHPEPDAVAVGEISSKRSGNALPPSARQATSVAPHSLPTPNAPLASPRTGGRQTRGWPEPESGDASSRSPAWIGAGALAGGAVV